VAVFAEDYAIRRYGERGNHIVHWSEFDRGGHFAAMEAPDLLVSDVRKFFRPVRWCKLRGTGTRWSWRPNVPTKQVRLECLDEAGPRRSTTRS
jgi:hypothetical protein